MRVKLEDVCEKVSSNLKLSDVDGKKGDFPVFGASGCIGSIDFYHQERAYVAVVKDGAGIGRTTINPPKSSVIGTMQYLIPKENICPQYLYYVVRNMHLEKYYTGATIPHIYFRDYKKEEFNLVSEEKQKAIVQILWKCENIIKLRHKELQCLDNLIKARFVEMFGEGLRDDGRFPLLPISHIGKVVSGATPKTTKENYWDGDNIWITPAELSDKSFIVCDSDRKITDEGVKSCAVNLLPVGTVILSSRAPIGKVAIAGVPMYCNQGFKNIIPNEKINSIYLFELLSMETKFLNSLGRGATFKEISKQIVESINVKVPPIQMQEQFADFVKQIDKSKVAVQKALDEAQLLFDSLMQEYFG